MVRAVMYGKELVSACFDDLSAVQQLGFENGLCTAQRVCIDQNSAMGLAGGVLCHSSMTHARFGMLGQKLCLVACYGPLPW